MQPPASGYRPRRRRNAEQHPGRPEWFLQPHRSALVPLGPPDADDPAVLRVRVRSVPVLGADRTASAGPDDYVVAVPHAQGDEWQFSGNGTDAAFVGAMVKHLESTYCIDTKRVFATGFSAGAAFTIIYACSRQGSIAAIATVAVEFQLGCTRPLSIMAFHGTKDPLVPYQNGAVGLSLPGVKVRGTQRNMSDWARLDRCRSHPRMKQIGSQVDRQSWTGCTGGTSVVLYSILGGGHSWPGADPKQSIGLTTQQISATSQILGFFDRSPS